MSKKPVRIPFQIKLLPENYKKMREESEKLGINMSAFITMLITDYKEIQIKKN